MALVLPSQVRHACFSFSVSECLTWCLCAYTMPLGSHSQRYDGDTCWGCTTCCAAVVSHVAASVGSCTKYVYTRLYGGKLRSCIMCCMCFEGLSDFSLAIFGLLVDFHTIFGLVVIANRFETRWQVQSINIQNSYQEESTNKTKFRQSELRSDMDLHRCRFFFIEEGVRCCCVINL